jgi:hypothetical protein
MDPSLLSMDNGYVGTQGLDLASFLHRCIDEVNDATSSGVRHQCVVVGLWIFWLRERR